jgi:hypothetical protein
LFVQEDKASKEWPKKRTARQLVRKDTKATAGEQAGAGADAGACPEKQPRKSRKRKRTESSEMMKCTETKKRKVDGMEKWDGLDVPHPVLECLCEMGFGEPTR